MDKIALGFLVIFSCCLVIVGGLFYPNTIAGRIAAFYFSIIN